MRNPVIRSENKEQGTKISVILGRPKADPGIHSSSSVSLTSKLGNPNKFIFMYCRVRISATSEKEANQISRTLVEKKLVAGTMISEGKCHYWWKDKTVERKYWNVEAFSLNKNKDAIIAEVKKIHRDECPIVAFNKIDGNEEFLRWIDESLE